ncbi:MAG TPA: IclR family transcriptional regulator [Jiangellaceae bacterium]|nr:IclR family transcriptional regulator [Jiangellaceae bacterium]
MTGPTKRSSDFVQSLERGLAVIRAFSADTPELTLSEVARATGLTRAAARRFLHTLVELGYVRTDSRLFALRPRVLELGYAYLSSLSLPQIAEPHMEQLVEKIHESCSVSILDGDHIVYVARVPTKRIMTVAISVGTRFPAYATSMGRVLLAHQNAAWLDEYLERGEFKPLTPYTTTDPKELATELARVRAQGYCLVDQELEEGLRSIAVPILDGSARVVAAMNVSAHISRGSATAIRQELLPALQQTAAEVSADLAAQ